MNTSSSCVRVPKYLSLVVQKRDVSQKHNTSIQEGKRLTPIAAHTIITNAATGVGEPGTSSSRAHPCQEVG